MLLLPAQHPFFCGSGDYTRRHFVGSHGLVQCCKVSSQRNVLRQRGRGLSRQNFKAFARLEVPSSNEAVAQFAEDKRLTLQELCGNKVPSHVLDRAEAAGLIYPTQIQQEALPVVLDGRDCIMHAQTGSGKTLAYMLPILSKISPTRSAVQALVVVPTRELGVQVARVARQLGGGVIIEETDEVDETKAKKTTVGVMTLLDGGTSHRQKKWLRAAPPQLVIGTLFTVCKMVEKGHLILKSLAVLVVDEVDTALHRESERLVSRLLAMYTSAEKRQTIFASATVPDHHHFIRKCLQNKWAKRNLTYVQPQQKMPANIFHRCVICKGEDRLEALHATVMADAPKAAFIFTNEQSSKDKGDGVTPKTRLMLEFFQRKALEMPDAADKGREFLIVEEDLNIHARFRNLRKMKEKGTGFILFATDLAARGLDVPEVKHIYNLELPSSTVAYIHRAGRTARKPLENEKCIVTTFITPKEEFVIGRLANEIDCSFELHKFS